MEKPSLLYVSPFPPLKSGISDYSVLLVNVLKQYFNCTLLTDDYEISDKRLLEFPVLIYGKDDIDYDKFDYKIYNIGNNINYHEYIYSVALNHPGMVILHEFVIWGLFCGYYIARNSLYSSIYNKIGIDGLLKMKHYMKANVTEIPESEKLKMITSMPMCEELINSGNKIMVHSLYTFDKILETGRIDKRRIRHIKLIEQIDRNNQNMIPKEDLFKKFNIPMDAVVLASFGYIQESKLNLEVCQAIKKLRDRMQGKICYVMVGEGDYIDHMLEPDFIIKTGYTDLEEFNSFMAYSDIILNMRYPTLGETSGAMLRILQLGKACITNTGGWFSEIPDDCVCKVELDNVVDNIARQLQYLLENDEIKKRIENNACEYVKKEHGGDLIAKQIYDFLSDNS